MVRGLQRTFYESDLIDLITRRNCLLLSGLHLVQRGQALAAALRLNLCYPLI